MRRVTSTDFRKDMKNYFNEIVYQRRRYILTCHSERCVIIPIEDYRKLEDYELILRKKGNEAVI